MVLDNILNRLFHDAKQILPVMKDLIKYIIYYHDFGKINPVFQKDKMKNILSTEDNLKLTSKHSLYGTILFGAKFHNYFFNKIEQINCGNGHKSRAKNLFFLLSLTIDRHHSSLNCIKDFGYKIKSDEKTRNEINDLIKISNNFLNQIWFIENLHEFYLFDLNKYFPNEEEKEAVFYLYKLVFSLLITSDYYATMEYMQGISYEDKINYLDSNIKDKIKNEFYKIKEVNGKHYNFNSKLKDNEYCNNLINKNLKKVEKINELRTKILLEADKTIKLQLNSNPEKRVFFLNVPTGGGKTNISLKLMLSILENKPNIKKVFYVFPFINIIEQNYDVIKNTLNLDGEISPIYSTAVWSGKSENKEEQLTYVLDNDFLNFPMVVMSNVNFFNAFIKSGKSENYKLHNLANSIVILDEIQSLNDNDWTMFSDFIKFSSEFLNIYYIIMSATLPQLDKISLKISSSDINQYSVKLIENSQDYYNHHLFRNRVYFDYREDINNKEQIIDKLFEEINKEKHQKILIVVNTIEDSRSLLTDLNSKKVDLLKDYNLYLLNSTILPHRRKEIIDQLNKNPNNSKIMLISTQSIEAGMDIDCDFGMRDFAVFDSIEQVAGRINRNFTNKTKRLLIVNLQKDGNSQAENVYRDSYRWKTIKDSYNNSEKIKEFIANRDFQFSEDSYYNKVISNINKQNKDIFRENPLDIVIKEIRKLDFEDLNNKEVIDQKGISIFIPISLSIKNFSESELNFLKEVNLNINKEFILGDDIWQAYKTFNENFNKTQIDKRIDIKRWASILSKFIISILDYYVEGQKLSEKLNLKSQKIVLLKNAKVYSEENGLNPKELQPSDFNSFEDLSV